MHGNQREGHAIAYSSVIDAAVGFPMSTRRAWEISPMEASVRLEILPIFLRRASYPLTKFPTRNGSF